MYSGPRPNARMMQIGSEFQEFITQLAHRQVEFDLGSENIIKDHGKVEGREFVLGKRSYDVVALPPGTENLDAATAKLLRQYAQAGGRLLSYAPGELQVDGAASGLSFPKSVEELSPATLFRKRRPPNCRT